MDATNTARILEKKNNPIANYEECAYYQFANDGEGFGLRESRQQLMDLNLDQNNATIIELDAIVIEATFFNEYVAPYLTVDDDSQPVKRWWWYLGAIRNKTYPAQLLPPDLREIYESAFN